MSEDNKAVCIALQEAIRDERAAPLIYESLKKELEQTGQLSRAREYIIDSIINEEKNHEKSFVLLSKQIGCSLSTRDPKRKEFYQLPLKERTKLAREVVSRMYPL